MRHTSFESLVDIGAEIVEKSSDFDLGGFAKNCEMRKMPHNIGKCCVHECGLVLISTRYPLAKSMRHTSFESLVDIGAEIVEKSFDFDLYGVAKIVKCEKCPKIDLCYGMSVDFS
jgi:hypothetical protein